MFGRCCGRRRVGDGKQEEEEEAHTETWFVRALNRRLFRAGGKAIASHPWLFITVSVALTAFCTVQIPLTPMTNDVADFTPTGARARRELEAYEAFFSNKGDPIALYVLVTAKGNGGNMFGVRELEETVRLLNTVSEQFGVFNSASQRNESFAQFCDNFCTINEPVRHFHSGLLLEQSFGNSSTEHIDLGYPITTVLGRQLHMDPHFFGVQVSVADGNGTLNTVSVNQLRTQQGQSVFDAPNSQLPNNIRVIKLIGLQFRAERPPGISKAAVARWERQVRHYVRSEFQSDAVSALCLSETFLTDEVVRAGLSLLPFLVIGFSIMVTFSSCTMSLAAFYVHQMGPQKVLLAIIACSCPFMACGTALGGMFWLGFRFGSLLCVTPFLVLALGVDDAYLLLNSWQRLRTKLEERLVREGKPIGVEQIVQRLMAEVMVDTGASITITTLTNVLAFAIGAMTPTPEIQLFSIGNAIAIIVVYIYQWTVFGSAMAIFGRWEFRTHPAAVHASRLSSMITPPLSPDPSMESSTGVADNASADSGIVKGSSSIISSVSDGDGTGGKGGIRKRSCGMLARLFRGTVRTLCSRCLDLYCRALTNTCCAFGVLTLLAGYLYISIYGVLTIRAELRPEQLFLRSSDVIELLRLRNEYIMPFYAVCMVFVGRPGNFMDPAQRQKLHSLVSDFERLPSSVGRFSTKFWLRDYEQFVEQDHDEADAPLPLDDLAAFEGIPLTERRRDELVEFLQWPEFQFWNGFLRLENSSDDDPVPVLGKFFFTTASYGAELRDWSQREALLGRWRRVADAYPELEVSVYEDDAKFLDLIPTMIPQTVQSSLCTLVCMFLVCLLFMTNPGALLVSNFAIFSTCLGVFGIQSLLGTGLDPIFMSAAIMSIGFSVDIPAHIAYHFYKTGTSAAGMQARAQPASMQERLRDCLAAIGFPVLEAGLSTLICTSSLFFVDLHMARVFARTMTLVVSIGLLHGLLVIPVLFSLCSSDRRTSGIRDQRSLPNNKGSMITEGFKRRMSLSRKSSMGVAPTVLTVNQQT